MTREVVTRLKLDTSSIPGAASSASSAIAGMARNAKTSFDAVATAARILPGLFAGGALGARLNKTTRDLLAIKDAAEATGSSIERISGLEDLARRTGSDFKASADMLVRFNGALKDLDRNKAAASVIERLGLDAAELRRLDPAEALQRTAKALAQFADDGDRARAVQDLFGESVKTAGPLLRELAEAGDLVGSATEESVRQADAFAKNLAALSTNAETAARVLTGPLIRGINTFFDEIGAGIKAYGNRPLAALFDIGLSVNPFKTLNENLTDTVDQIGKAKRQLEDLRNSPLPDFLGVRRMSERELEGQLQILASRERYLQQQLKAAGGGRGGDPRAQPTPRSLGGSGSAAGGGRGGNKQPDAPGDVLGEFLIERVLPDAKRRDEALAQREAAALASRMDAQESFLRQLVDSNERASVELIADEAQRARALVDLERQTQQRRIDALFEFGPDRARAEQEADRQRERGLQEILRREEERERNAQEARTRRATDLLSNIVTAGFEGRFDDIGKQWERLLLQMAANAAAADLAALLFGGKGGNIANLFFDFGSAIGLDLFGRAGGGSVNARAAYLVGEQGPEVLVMGGRGGTIVPNAQLPSGGAVAPVVNITMNIDSRSDAAQVAQTAAQAVRTAQEGMWQQLKARGLV